MIAGVHELVEALDESNIEEALLQLRRVPRNAQTPPAIIAAVFNSLRKYSISAHNFSPAAATLAEILDLVELQQPVVWTELVGEERTVRAFDLNSNLRFAKRHLPKVAEALKQESQGIIKSSEGKSEGEGKSVLSVIVIEEGQRFSSPERLIEVLESVDTLYRMCSTMNGVPPEGLCVIACDSGSDKSFDFLGLAKVIECVKEIILSMWDRVVFYKERQLSERIGLVSQTLPIFGELEKLAEAKALEPEQIELVRRGLVAGISKFMESGATIPEVEKFTHYNPRKLMAPEPKLLVSAPEDAGSKSPAPNDAAEVADGDRDEVGQSGELNFDQLGNEERDTLIRLLEKSRKKNGPNSADSSTAEMSEEEPDES